MPRHRRTVGFVRSGSGLGTVKAIASRAGLHAARTEQSGLYTLLDTGREIDSEVGEQLLHAARRELDRAVHSGTISSWHFASEP